MGFVNGKKADFQAFEQWLKSLRHQFFGADVEELDVASEEGIFDVALLVERKGAVDECRWNAIGAEAFHLVFHQRDERADHHCHAFECDGGDLVTNALPTARGHQHERVFFVKNGLDDVGLQGPELVVAKVFFERSRSVGERHG